MKKKKYFGKIVAILFLFAIIAASFQSIAKATAAEDSKISPSISEESLSEKGGLCVTPAGLFDLPPEVEAKMSKEEIYALQAVPGYFKPQQVSVPQSLLEQGDPQPVKAVVIVDEEMRGYLAWLTYGYWIPELVSWEEVYDWAWNILEGGDDFLEILFGIDMQMVINTNWETPDGWNYHDLLYAIDDVDPRGVGCDILILITGQQDWGLDGLAWCPCPGTPMEGRHFVMDCTVGLTANLFQHEATHLFGPHDHGWNPLIPCIMSYYWTWQLRIYCSACTTNIDQHRFRYD